MNFACHDSICMLYTCQASAPCCRGGTHTLASLLDGPTLLDSLSPGLIHVDSYVNMSVMVGSAMPTNSTPPSALMEAGTLAECARQQAPATPGQVSLRAQWHAGHTHMCGLHCHSQAHHLLACEHAFAMEFGLHVSALVTSRDSRARCTAPSPARSYDIMHLPLL